MIGSEAYSSRRRAASSAAVVSPRIAAASATPNSAGSHTLVSGSDSRSFARTRSSARTRLLVRTGLGREHGLDGPQVAGVGVHERRIARELLDDREELAASPLHPPDGEQLCEVPRVGVGVAHFGAEAVALGCGCFCVTEPAGSHEQHRVDGRDDVASQEHVELLGPQSQVGERSFGFDVSEEEQIDGAPQQAHDRERAVAGPRRDAPSARRRSGDARVRTCGVRTA